MSDWVLWCNKLGAFFGGRNELGITEWWSPRQFRPSHPGEPMGIMGLLNPLDLARRYRLCRVAKGIATRLRKLGVDCMVVEVARRSYPRIGRKYY